MHKLYSIYTFLLKSQLQDSEASLISQYILEDMVTIIHHQMPVKPINTAHNPTTIYVMQVLVLIPTYCRFGRGWGGGALHVPSADFMLINIGGPVRLAVRCTL